MQQVFENIIEKLEEEKRKGHYDFNSVIGEKNVWQKAIEIVKQEAEKFGTDTNVGSNGWIPCSERLPENVDHLADGDKKKQYLVMTRNGRYEVAEWLEVYDKPFWCGHYSQEIKDVIRWKPLETYQPKGE